MRSQWTVALRFSISPIVGRNCRFKDCLDFFYFFVCLLYSPFVYYIISNTRPSFTFAARHCYGCGFVKLQQGLKPGSRFWEFPDLLNFSTNTGYMYKIPGISRTITFIHQIENILSKISFRFCIHLFSHRMFYRECRGSAALGPEITHCFVSNV